MSSLSIEKRKMTNLFTVISLVIFAVLEAAIVFLKRRWNISFTQRIIVALIFGLIYGAVLQLVFGADGDVTTLTNSWFGIVGSGFTKALQFLIVPVVLVSIMSAIVKANTGSKAAKSSGQILFVLLSTTAVAAVIGFASALIFHLDASELVSSVTESTDKTPTDIPTSLLNFIPSNLFDALSSNSAIPVVLIGALVGFAILSLKKDDARLGERFVVVVDASRKLVMAITDLIIGFTPYGVLALIAKITCTKDFGSVLVLLQFVLALYIAILVMFAIHLIILRSFHVNIGRYLHKVSPALVFAFTSRSSAATLPLTIQAQTEGLGVDDASANLSSSFGVTIGQNGCAGIYPALVATVVAKALGWDVASVGFLALLVIYVVITSFGIGGVGGGATNATILLLSLFGLPIDLVAILISVDFIVDMARTALNVNDSILAGVITSKLDNTFNEEVFISDNYPVVEATKN